MYFYIRGVIICIFFLLVDLDFIYFRGKCNIRSKFYVLHKWGIKLKVNELLLIYFYLLVYWFFINIQNTTFNKHSLFSQFLKFNIKFGAD